MKSLQIISPSSYCPIKRPFDKDEIFVKFVQAEDILNHKFTPITIPKMNYIHSTLKGPSLKAFLKQILP